LTTIARNRRIGEINVVAHSMGGWLTVEALRQLRLSGQGDVLDRLQVVLASPDIDVDLFRAQMDVIGRTAQPMVVLVAPDDRVLQVSRRLGAPTDRLGALDVTDPRVQETALRSGIALVDITSLEATDGLRHGRYALLGSVLADMEESGAAAPGTGIRRAGAFVFNAVGATISSPFTLVGDALAAE
jgi:esterase/lipase superfamily enzyme